MRYFFTKFRAHLRRGGTVLLVFGLTALVLAYLMGVYDISFIDREALLGTAGKPSADTETETDTALPETDTTPADTADPADTETETVVIPGNTGTVTVQKQSRSVTNVTNPDLLSDQIKSVSTTSALSSRDYTMTTADWSESTRLGKVKFGFAMPSVYSLRTRTVDKLQYVYPEDNTEYYASTVKVTEDRPAVELYMGYLLYDKGKEIIVIDSDGKVLLSYDAAYTFPAYLRDKNGLPLFYRLNWTEEGMETVYYRISDDGKYLIPADYDPVMDSRGLSFDYPAWYGLSDNMYLVRMQEGEEMVDARLEEEATRLSAMTEEEILAEEEQRKLDKTVVFNAYDGQRIAYYKYGSDMTGYIYREAFNFRDGYAAVTADENRQEMFFITETGRKALSGFKMYLKTDYERYVIESWRLPASYGIESIGSLYFDHGYVRVRKQIIDNWAYMTYDNIRVISDTDVLIDKQGKEFPIPSGYVLKGYSCGMLLLEKDGRYGFMDYTGHWVAEPVYAAATPFIGGLATLTTPDGRVGMIDTHGDIILAFAYQSISQVSSGLVASYHAEEGWQVYKIMDK